MSSHWSKKLCADILLEYSMLAHAAGLDPSARKSGSQTVALLNRAQDAVITFEDRFARRDFNVRSALVFINAHKELLHDIIATIAPPSPSRDTSSAMNMPIVASRLDPSSLMDTSSKESSVGIRAVFNKYPTVVVCGFARSITNALPAYFKDSLNVIVRYQQVSIMTTVAENPDLVCLCVTDKVKASPQLKYLANKLGFNISVISDLKDCLIQYLNQFRNLPSVPTVEFKTESLIDIFIGTESTDSVETKKPYHLPVILDQQIILALPTPLSVFALQQLQITFPDLRINQTDVRALSFYIKGSVCPIVIQPYTDVVLPRVARALSLVRGRVETLDAELIAHSNIYEAIKVKLQGFVDQLNNQ